MAPKTGDAPLTARAERFRVREERQAALEREQATASPPPRGRRSGRSSTSNRSRGGARQRGRQNSRAGSVRGGRQTTTSQTRAEDESGTQQQQTGPTNEETGDARTQQTEQQGQGSVQEKEDDGAAQQRQADSGGQVTEQSNAGAASPTTGATNVTSGAANTPAQEGTSKSGDQVNGGRARGEAETEKDGKSNANGKRRRSSSGSGQCDPKKPKIGDSSGHDGGAGEQSQQQQSGEDGPCARLRRLLRTYSEMPAPARDPAPHNRTVEDEDVYRAVVAVTEAVSTAGTHQFSFIDWTSLNVAITLDRDAVVQTVARPRNEMLIPWIANNHHSLFYLQRQGEDNQFRVLHFDSALRFGHRANLPAEYARVRQRLQHIDWTGRGAAGDATIPFESTIVPVVRQDGAVQCGLHVIFSAWALALGLRIGQAMDQRRYRDFYRDGEILIRQAVRGTISSEAIFAFLDCYGYIEPGQQVDDTRSFENTIAFAEEHDLATRTGRTRLQAALPAYEDLDAVVAEIAPEADNLYHLSTRGFLQMYNDHQETVAAGMQSGHQRPESSQNAGSGPGASNSVRPAAEEGDENDPAMQRALAESIGLGAQNNQNGSSSGPLRQTSASTTVAAPPRTDGHENDDNDRNSGRQSDDLPSSPSSPSSAQPTPPASDHEGQPQVPGTTAVLSGIPAFLKPSEPSHNEWSRQRQHNREEALELAMQHVANAQALAGTRDSSVPSAPSAPPPTATTEYGMEPKNSDNHREPEDDEGYSPPPAEALTQDQVDTPGMGSTTADADEFEGLFDENQDLDFDELIDDQGNDEDVENGNGDADNFYDDGDYY